MKAWFISWCSTYLQVEGEKGHQGEAASMIAVLKLTLLVSRNYVNLLLIIFSSILSSVLSREMG